MVLLQAVYFLQELELYNQSRCFCSPVCIVAFTMWAPAHRVWCYDIRQTPNWKIYQLFSKERFLELEPYSWVKIIYITKGLNKMMVSRFKCWKTTSQHKPQVHKSEGRVVDNRIGEVNQLWSSSSSSPPPPPLVSHFSSHPFFPAMTIALSST